MTRALLRAALGLAAAVAVGAEPAAAPDDAAYATAVRRALRGISAPMVNTAEAARLIAEDGAVVLDTRAREEWEVSHLPGARLVEFGLSDAVFGPGLPDGLPPKDRPVVVYCTIGWRSGKVAERLRAAGWTRAVNVFGGIIQWHNEGRPLVDVRGTPATRVHPYNKDWERFVKKP